VQLDGCHLYVNDVLSSRPFLFEFNAFHTRVLYKTKFPDDINIVLEAQLLRCSTHVSWFVLHFNLFLHQCCYCYLAWFHQFYLSLFIMMSRQILFQDIPNTTSHCAPKRKFETDTNQGNFCAIATILSLLFSNPEILLILSFEYFPFTHILTCSYWCFLVKLVYSCIIERSFGMPKFYFVLGLMSHDSKKSKSIPRPILWKGPKEFYNSKIDLLYWSTDLNKLIFPHNKYNSFKNHNNIHNNKNQHHYLLQRSTLNIF
jgi:hypothetical protein